MQIVGIIITTFHNIHNSVYNLVFTQLLLGLTHTSRIPPDMLALYTTKTKDH